MANENKVVLFDWIGTLFEPKSGLRPGSEDLVQFLHEQGFALQIVTSGSFSDRNLRILRSLYPNFMDCFGEEPVLDWMDDVSRAREAVKLGVPIVDDNDLLVCIDDHPELQPLQVLYIDPKRTQSDQNPNAWADRVKEAILALYT